MIKLLEEVWVWHIGISVFFITYSYYLMIKLVTDAKRFHYIDMAVKLLFIGTVYMGLHIYRVLGSIDMRSFETEYPEIYNFFN